VQIACKETDSLGDISTLADETVVHVLIGQVNALLDANQKKTAPVAAGAGAK
jgi:hypothetical protein